MKRIIIVALFCAFLGLNAASFAQYKTSRGTVQYEVALKNSATVSIKGRVIDSETDLPLLAASINVVGKPLGAATMENGEYLVLVPSGSNTLRVSHPSYKSLEKSITATENHEIELDFALQKENIPQDPRGNKKDYFVAVEDLPEPIGGIQAIQEKAVYPEIAKRAGIQGTVFVEAFIDELGNVVATNVVRGVKEDTDRMLDRAAQEAVAKTKFIPGKQAGRAVKVRMSIPIRFRLTTTSTEKGTTLSNNPTFILRVTADVVNEPVEFEGSFVSKSDQQPIQYVKQRVPFETRLTTDLVLGFFQKKKGEGWLRASIFELKDGEEHFMGNAAGNVVIVSITPEVPPHQSTRKVQFRSLFSAF